MRATYATGSPPQVRGKLSHTPCVLPHDRITPAGAGKTQKIQCPHCGEWGSPPQVRGKQHGSKNRDCGGGITPAGAGKTAGGFDAAAVSEDHPRRCGENILYMAHVRVQRGSPPQVRGKRSSASSRASGEGITPAGAGKTQHRRNCSRLRKDHPRRCGENEYITYEVVLKTGSPPQVRGKRKRQSNT